MLTFNIRLWKYFSDNIPIGISEAAVGYLREGLQTERGLRGLAEDLHEKFHYFYPILRFTAFSRVRAYILESPVRASQLNINDNYLLT